MVSLTSSVGVLIRGNVRLYIAKGQTRGFLPSRCNAGCLSRRQTYAPTANARSIGYFVSASTIIEPDSLAEQVEGYPPLRESVLGMLLVEVKGRGQLASTKRSGALASLAWHVEAP